MIPINLLMHLSIPGTKKKNDQEESLEKDMQTEKKERNPRKLEEEW